MARPSRSPKKVRLRWLPPDIRWLQISRVGSHSIPQDKNGKETSRGNEYRLIRDILNTIVGGFYRGCETVSTRKRYARQIITIEDSPAIVDYGL